ncbi:MAG: TetR family transcriptional regulator [Desulfobacteraceae bacterium]|nr:TetR family transcriptional regulator [Desulfobacteraceae bacterium]MBC2755720.1 TetR family transcriptional regulator [Desulfobacteraceae bacterium]
MEKNRKWYKISELERLSGVSRRTIHFYLQNKLLHAPFKTGKTMSYYDDEHLMQLGIIKQLKAEGLPLFLIKEKIENRMKDPARFNERKTTPTQTAKVIKDGRKKQTMHPKGRKTKEKIIERGCDFFCQKGYKDTHVSDITRALNVGKGTFYFYFKDKKELLLECMPLIFEALFSKGWSRIRKEQAPIKRLELRAQAVFPVLPQFCAIIQLCKEAMEDDDPNVKRLGRDILLSIRKPLEADIEKGVAAGIFRAIDPKIAGTMMIGIIESMYYLKNVDPDLDHSSMWDSIVGMLIFGIKK